MSSLHDDVQRAVDQLLDSHVFVVSHPPSTGLTSARPCIGPYDEVDASGKTWHIYPTLLDIPLRWNATDDEYDRKLGETRIEITQEGHAALCDALGGECPHCKRAMPEGEPH